MRAAHAIAGRTSPPFIGCIIRLYVVQDEMQAGPRRRSGAGREAIVAARESWAAS